MDPYKIDVRNVNGAYVPYNVNVGTAIPRPRNEHELQEQFEQNDNVTGVFAKERELISHLMLFGE